MIEDLSECYHILDLEQGATLEDVKLSYRELVKVWHPDRFSNDPKLQKKAQEKLKLINLAYERICKGEGAGSSGSSGRPSGQQQDEPHHSPPPRPQTTPSAQPNWGRRLVQIAVTVLIIAIVKAVFSTGDHSRRQPSDHSPLYTQPSQSHQTPSTSVVQPPPNARQSLNADRSLQLLREAWQRKQDLRMSDQEFRQYLESNHIIPLPLAVKNILLKQRGWDPSTHYFDEVTGDIFEGQDPTIESTK